MKNSIKTLNVKYIKSYRGKLSRKNERIYTFFPHTNKNNQDTSFTIIYSLNFLVDV